MLDDTLQLQIDWEKIIPMKRRAGGHDEQMKGLFKGATVLAHWNEGDYQGSVATAVKLADGRYCWYQDSYGSCSGYDAWEDATDSDVRKLCTDLANGAEVFSTYALLVEHLQETMKGNAKSWCTSAAQGLLDELAKKSLNRRQPQ